MHQFQQQLAAWATGFLLLFGGPLVAQFDLSEEQFQERSLQYRKALHYDPLIESALDSLVRLYGDAERSDELVGLYQGHIAQYPDDAGAKTVLVRVLHKLKRAGVEQQLAAAAQVHPDFAPIQYVLFQFLDENSDPRSLEALSRAIDLQTNPARRNEWLDELLARSNEDDGRKLAAAQLQKLIDVPEQTPQNFMELARLMQRYQYWEMSLSALSKAKEGQLDPESGIEAEILSATAEAALGNRQAAGRRLDSVLGRLSPDHWRRSQVMSQRVSVLATEAERNAMLKVVRDRYQKNPKSESAILDMAEMLIASEKRGDAADLLADSSLELPDSELLEKRAVEELRAFGDFSRFEQYLEERLEQSPGRQDLRLELVKVHYALDKDLDARQDLQSVLAGLDTEESSGLILETGRFLQTRGKLQSAVGLLKAFVEKNPTRLDVVRELAEIYVKMDDRGAISDLLSLVDVEGAKVENLLDLAGFLVENSFLVVANRMLESRLKAEPDLFEVGLLHIRVLGEIGDPQAAAQRIEKVRKLADSSPRYAQWLEASLEAYALFERQEQFFDSEEARYSYSGEEWTPQRLERFLLLCELAGKRRMSDRVSRAIQTQLAATGISVALKTKLRQLLVSSLENDPGKVEAVEEQLQLLEIEDPDNVASYELQRAILYREAGRLDLAEGILGSIDFSKVKNVNLLRDSVPMALDFGFPGKAIEALAAITTIEPRDVFSWERRLSLLVSQRNEKEFRSVVRSLLQDVDSLQLKESTKNALNRHLLDSYWRSVAALLASGEVGAVLPILDSVERDAMGGNDQLWAKWTRVYVLLRLDRIDEAQTVFAGLEKLPKEMDEVLFPDGLVLSLEAAKAMLNRKREEEQPLPTHNGDSLLQSPNVSWAFEVDEGSSILRLRSNGASVMALDDRGQVYRIDAATGKLKWKENLGIPDVLEPEAGSIRQPVIPVGGEQPSNLADAKMVRDIQIDSERFFLMVGDGVAAYSIENCELQWRAKLVKPAEASVYTPANGAWPESSMGVADGKLVVFEPRIGRVSAFETAGGKLHWSRLFPESEESTSDLSLFSLNSGLSVSNGKVFVYGLTSAILDLETGQDEWRFNEEMVNEFPIKIREEKDGDSPTAAEVISLIDSGEGAGWKSGNITVPGKSSITLVDHLNGRNEAGSDDASIDPDIPTRFVAPAVHWARGRLNSGLLARGELGDDFLWLMEKEGIRRISLHLPLASVRLKAEGTFLGESGNHVWLIRKGELIHVDFRQGQSFRHSVSSLGPEDDLRGVLAGTRVIVRGQKGVKILNSFSGRTIAEWAWPEELTDYLSELNDSGEGNNPVVEAYKWQGVVQKGAPGQPAYCYPITDIVSERLYVTTFRDDCVVALGDAEVPAVSTEEIDTEVQPAGPQ